MSEQITSQQPNKKIPLSNTQYIVLTIYFTVLLVLSIFSSVYFFIINHSSRVYVNISPAFLSASKTELNILSFTLIACISTSIMGCSIFYIRKLYKLALSESLDPLIESKNFNIKEYASLIYFFTRPLYSVCFAIITLIGINAGLLNVSSGVELNNTFCDLIMFITFFIGFATGKFLTFVKDKSDKIIKDSIQAN